MIRIRVEGISSYIQLDIVVKFVLIRICQCWVKTKKNLISIKKVI